METYYHRMPSLLEIVPNTVLSAICEVIARFGGVVPSIQDPDGRVIVDPIDVPQIPKEVQRMRRLCKRIQSTTEGQQACRDSDKELREKIAARLSDWRPDKPIIVEQVTCHFHFREWASPIMYESQVVGFVFAGGAREKAFSEKELKRCGDHCLAALKINGGEIEDLLAAARSWPTIGRLVERNVRNTLKNAAEILSSLYQNLYQHHRTMEHLSQVSRRVAAIVDMDEVLSSIISCARAVIPLSSAAVWIPKIHTGEKRILIARCSHHDAIAEHFRHFPVGEGWIGRVFSEAERAASGHKKENLHERHHAQLVEDLLAKVREQVSLDPNIEKRIGKNTGGLAVPLMVMQKCIGVLHITRKDCCFTERHRYLLDILAPFAAAAINNARSYEPIATEQSLFSPNDTEVDYRPSNDNLESLVVELLERAKNVTGAISSSLRIVDRTGRFLHLRNSWPEEWGRRLSPIIAVGEGITGTAAQEKKIQDVANLVEDERFKALVLRPDARKAYARYRSEIAFPLLKNGTLLGTFDVHSDRLFGFSEFDRKVLHKLAQHAAAAVADLDALEEQSISRLLMELANAVQKRLGYDDVLESALDCISSHHRFRRCRFYQFHNGSLVSYSSRGLSARHAQMFQNRQQPLVYDVGPNLTDHLNIAMQRGTPVVVCKNDDQPRFEMDVGYDPGGRPFIYVGPEQYREDPDMLEKKDVVEWLDIPIIAGPPDKELSHVLGKLVVDRQKKGEYETVEDRFSLVEIEKAAVLGQIVAEALSRARSFEAEKRKALVAMAGRSAHITRSKASGVLAYMDDILDMEASRSYGQNALLKARMHVSEIFHELDKLVLFAKLPPDSVVPSGIVGGGPTFDSVNVRELMYDVASLTFGPLGVKRMLSKGTLGGNWRRFKKRIWADRKLAASALSELMGNARQAAGKEGIIRITGTTLKKKGKSWVAIGVQDSGPGVPSHLRPHLFDEPPDSPSAGYGLSIVDRIMKLHGGRVVYDERGGFSTFSLLFPDSPRQRRIEGAIQERATIPDLWFPKGVQEMPGSVLAFQPKKVRHQVFVVEDDIFFQEGIASYLRRRGFSVKCLTDVTSRELACLRGEMCTALVIDMDFGQPSGGKTGIKGVELVAERNGNTPIIVCSAFFDDDEIVEGLTTDKIRKSIWRFVPKEVILPHISGKTCMSSVQVIDRLLRYILFRQYVESQHSLVLALERASRKLRKAGKVLDRVLSVQMVLNLRPNNRSALGLLDRISRWEAKAGFTVPKRAPLMAILTASGCEVSPPVVQIVYPRTHEGVSFAFDLVVKGDGACVSIALFHQNNPMCQKRLSIRGNEVYDDSGT